MTIQRTAKSAGLALGGRLRAVDLPGHDPVLGSRFPLGTVAGTALVELGCAAAELGDLAGGGTGAVSSSVLEGAQHLVSFGLQRLNGAPVPRSNQTNPFVRAYLCEDDRWIYLHGGFSHLSQGLADLLTIDSNASRSQVADAVRQWNSHDLEAAIARERLCGAIVRTPGEWRAHPQGQALAKLPVVRTTQVQGETRGWEPHAIRPLAGLRVLDLTRVLAGPTCGKYLAALGADVLNIRGPHVPSEAAFVIDTGLGKRQAWCDFGNAEQLDQLVELAHRAHVIVCSYRPGVAQHYGLDSDALRNTGWSGLYGTVSCYGPEGPWARRAGWEQVAQAATGMQSLEGGLAAPAVSPAAATDYITGIALAGAICRALATSKAIDLAASLCQTAGWILRQGAVCDPQEATGTGEPALEDVVTEFGRLSHLPPGFTVEGLQVGWTRPPRPLGSGSMRW